MKNIFLILSIFLVLRATTVPAQQPGNKIHGIIYADTAADYTAALIELLKEDQKTIVKIGYANSNGEFTINDTPTGKYYLKISGISFETYRSELIQLSADLNLGKLKVKLQARSLNEVNVVASKPLVEHLYNKTIVNVAASINSTGNTALDVLAKSPGVSVDKDDNISMRGRPGVQVMIDGKLVPISGQDLADLLRNLSSSQIDKIELLTNPSAQYDAQGSAGIIDIKLKKDSRLGTNGSVTATLSQGRYPKYSPGFSINNRAGAFNLFFSYTYDDRENYNNLQIQRSFYDQNNLYTGGYNEVNYLRRALSSNNIRFGADYYFTPNTIIGFVASGIYAKNVLNGNNHTIALNNKGQDTSYFNTTSQVSPIRNSNSIDLNLKSTLSPLKNELSVNLDYAGYDRSDIQNYLTNYYNLAGVQDQPAYVLYGNLKGSLTIRSANADYSQPLGKNIKLSLGAKSSWVNSDNQVDYYNRSNGGNVLDTTKSDHFIYDENINAAYANGSGSWGKTSVQLGLRMENTNIRDVLVNSDSTYRQNYTQLFPSGDIGYKIDQNNDLALSVSRRINRPTYAQLNPFKTFIDPTTYIEGNPYLKPETSYNYEFTWTFKENYSLSIDYDVTSNNILPILSPDAVGSDVVVQEPRNVAKYYYYDVSLFFPVTIGKWLNSTNNFVLYYGKYNGEIANIAITNSKLAYSVNSENSISINKSWSGEVTGTYQSSSIYGFLNALPYGSLDMGLQKKIMKNRGSLKFSVSDILYTNYFRANTVIPGYTEHFIQKTDSRFATVSFAYRFGNNQLQSRKRDSGAEDEKRRANG